MISSSWKHHYHWQRQCSRSQNWVDEQPAPKEDLDFCFEVDGCIAAKQLLSIRSQVIIVISAKTQRLQHIVVGRRVVDIGHRWPPVPQRPAQETSEAEKETSPKSIMKQSGILDLLLAGALELSLMTSPKTRRGRRGIGEEEGKEG